MGGGLSMISTVNEVFYEKNRKMLSKQKTSCKAFLILYQPKHLNYRAPNFFIKVVSFMGGGGRSSFNSMDANGGNYSFKKK